MKFQIKEPRWHDRVVLLKASRVTEYNEVTFDTPTLTGTFWISGDKVKDSPLDSNGVIKCYAVPLTELEQWDSDK